MTDWPHCEKCGFQLNIDGICARYGQCGVVVEDKQYEKQKRSGLRRCLGHKYGAEYDKKGQCSICKGYNYAK